MTAAKAPPIIFDEDLLILRRARAAKRGPSFLMKRCLTDLVDRLQDINRNFENVLIYGPEALAADLKAKLPEGKIKNISSCEALNHLSSEKDFDLVISLLRLQSLNDPLGAMILLSKRLKPDGLFIGAMFGGDTLSELRQVFYAVDEEYLGGMSAHIYPMANYSQVAGLISRAGLNQPVVDTDRFTVSYSRFNTLISDLRDLGETNVLVTRDKRPIGRAYKKSLETHYRDTFSNEKNKLECNFEILWLTGWKPHKSQQKPLKPGSAKMRLEDSLKGIAQKTKPK